MIGKGGDWISCLVLWLEIMAFAWYYCLGVLLLFMLTCSPTYLLSIFLPSLFFCLIALPYCAFVHPQLVPWSSLLETLGGNDEGAGRTFKWGS